MQQLFFQGCSFYQVITYYSCVVQFVSNWFINICGSLRAWEIIKHSLMYRTSEVVCVSAFIIKMCRKISNIRCAKSQNFNVSRLGLQLSSDNILKPCVQLLQTHIKETSNYAFLALFGDSPMTSDFPSKGSAMWKMFPFDDIIMMGNNLSCTHFISSTIIDLTMNINPFPMVCCIWWYFALYCCFVPLFIDSIPMVRSTNHHSVKLGVNEAFHDVSDLVHSMCVSAFFRQM